MSKGAKLNITAGVWILVVLLFLLVAASGLLLYTILGNLAVSEHNVIALVPAHGGEGAVPTPTPAEGEEVWEINTPVDLFKSTYTDANGNVVVESAKGDKLIAPGASNVFEFSLKNTGNVTMDFVLSLEGLFHLADRGLPFEVRLRSGDTWLMGDETTWLPAASLQELSVSDTLERDAYIDYALEWRWPREGNDAQDRLLADLNDTLVGTAGNTAEVTFSLNINTVATLADGALPTNDFGVVIITHLVSPVLWYILLGLAILLLSGGITWWIIAKQKKKTDGKAPE